MRHFITIVLLILLPLCAKADNSQLYKQLDAAIEKRAHYVEVKEKSLNDIKQGCSSSPKWTQKMIINYLYF